MKYSEFIQKKQIMDVPTGIPDYLVAVRAPGENPQPISHPDGLTEFYGENEPTSGNLKKSYFDQAVKNLVNAENIAETGTLFDF